jgi:hypothetical protein
MAKDTKKSKGGAKASIKITFGDKKKGRAKKAYGPKQQKPKRYKGQGRRR